MHTYPQYALGRSARISPTEESRPLKESIRARCPYCGEPVELFVDEGGGKSQAYVEDCPVCCRPWEVEVVEVPDGGWSASLRTSDE